MPLLETESVLEKKQNVIQHLFKICLNDKRAVINQKLFMYLQKEYGVSVEYFRRIIGDVRYEVELFACSKEIRLKFLPYRDKIEKVLVKLGVILVDTDGEKYLNHETLISYKTISNEMAKHGINITQEEMRWILGEYHILTHFPFCNYDCVIAKDISSGNSELKLKGKFLNSGIENELIKFYKKSGIFSNTMEAAMAFLKIYFVPVKPINFRQLSVTKECSRYVKTYQKERIKQEKQDKRRAVFRVYNSQELLQIRPQQYSPCVPLNPKPTALHNNQYSQMQENGDGYSINESSFVWQTQYLSECNSDIDSQQERAKQIKGKSDSPKELVSNYRY